MIFIFHPSNKNQQKMQIKTLLLCSIILHLFIISQKEGRDSKRFGLDFTIARS